MRTNKREDKVIEQFCERLSEIELQTVQVVERPDRDYPGLGGCDAVIERGNRRFALEHTSISSFLNQRKDDARFNKVVVPLEQAIPQAFPDSWVEIAVPVGAVPTGTNWSKMTENLRDGCISAIAQMQFGETGRKFEFEDFPFPVWISRYQTCRSACHVMRFVSSKLKAQLENDMSRAVCKKRKQLAPYKKKGMSTLLILDSDDISLVNHYSLAEAFSKAAEGNKSDGLDEVFLAESDRDPIWFFPVKLYDRLYPNLPEFRQFFEAQYFLTYGEE